MSSSAVTLIVPTYNEAKSIRAHLEYHQTHFNSREILVVDGGSSDGTVGIIRRLPDPVRLIHRSPPDRSRQLAEGARVADSNWLLFLHADTYLPRNFDLKTLPAEEPRWGWFDCRLDDDAWIYQLIGRAISIRSRLFSSPTGDQALWLHRSLLEAIDGVPDQPLMEDVELSRRLRRETAGEAQSPPVTTSARRWKQNGVLRTILTMWILKLGYLLGVAPERLARIYRRGHPS